ncbi:MAG: cell division protein FtsQ/DivIB [Burkholderia sp.]|nr:cell division protein FtsQ/DivIB [Burkholderia sp.]
MWNNVRQLNLAANILRILFILSFVVIALLYLIRSQMFVIHTICIAGDTVHIKVLDAQDSIVNKINGNFFTINLDVVRNAFEKMPWIRRASVRRIWPNKLLVILEEYRPLSIWGNGHSDQFVSIDGDLFTGNQNELKESLPSLYGPEGNVKSIVKHYYDFIRWFAPLNLKISKITMSSSYAWTIQLSNGMKVELGKERDSQSLSYIVHRFVNAWTTLIKYWGNNIEYVDLRYPNGFVIRCAKRIFLHRRYSSKEEVDRTSKSIL